MSLNISLELRLQLRPLIDSDYGKEYLAVLAQLSSVGTVSQTLFTTRVQEIQKCGEIV